MAAVPDAAVDFLLENLKDFVLTNKELMSGAEDNANALFNDLEMLKAFLAKCTQQKYSEDDFLSKLAKKVRKLVYRAEDAIETYIATVSKQKFRGAVRGALHAIDHVLELRNIGKELDALVNEVKDVYQVALRDGLQVMKIVNDEEAGKSEGVVRKVTKQSILFS